MSAPLFANLNARPDAARALQNYRRLAQGYDGTCKRIERLRMRAIQELGLRPGETVFDVACGTGPTLPTLAAAVGPGGAVVGIEMCPEMASQARARVAAARLEGIVEIIESAVEMVHVRAMADAVLFCYTHDVLQSPAALDRFNLYRARCYMTTYRNLRRPWRLLEQRGVALREVHSELWGSAYIASGNLPQRPARASGWSRAPAERCPTTVERPQHKGFP
jgi:SAM-dependent methyltransferase